jgi:hypothetical protein
MKKLPDALLADLDVVVGDIEWRGVVASMVSRILLDKASPCSSSFVVGDVGVVDSSNAPASDNDREPFVSFNGVSRVAEISTATIDFFLGSIGAEMQLRHRNGYLDIKHVLRLCNTGGRPFMRQGCKRVWYIRRRRCLDEDRLSGKEGMLKGLWNTG